MGGFTKLYNTILDSTIWDEPPHIKIVWITLLAMADRHGQVLAPIPGLARRAVVSLEQCKDALNRFLSPDPYSRTPDHEGRRIESIDGGWRLLNYQKYRDMRDEETRRELNREAQRRHRASADVSNGQQKSAPSAKAEAEAEAEAEAKEEEDGGKNNPPTEGSGEGQEEAPEKPKMPKRTKPKKTPDWAQAYSEEVLNLIFSVRGIWPDRKYGHIQPSSQAKPNELVPLNDIPKLGKNLKAALDAGAELEILLAIAQIAVAKWKAGERWINGAQGYFGTRDDAPWKADYKAYVTNQKNKAP